MSWDNSLSDFLDLLVRYYPDRTSARDVAEKAGLNTRFRIVCPGGVDTAFLTRDNLLITNHDVIASAEEAKRAKTQFNFQETREGLATQVAEFALTPEDGFATSPLEGGDDWTAVRVNGDPSKEWGVLPLVMADVKANDYVNIIQHPGGVPKQIALNRNLVTFVGGDRVHYLTDTLPGSSGSPVFDIRWRVVALHHSGAYLTEPGSSGKRLCFRNEGIHVKAILEGLGERGI
jgi:V8-like Glu-specific endopeptidase